MPTDGGTGGRSRRDTANQRAARQRVADTLQCPSCGRRNALSARYREDMGDHVLVIRYCRYCQASQTRRID